MNNSHIKNRVLTLQLQLIICIVLSSIVLAFFLVFYKIIDKKQFRKYDLIDDIKLINSVENLSIVNDIITISGYAFLLNTDASEYTNQIVLKSVETDDEIWFNMEQINRPDVNAYYKSKHDYSNSGFLAKTKINNLEDDIVYEIIIINDYINNKAKKNRIAVSSKRYVLNKQLYNYNPYEFDNPIINDESSLLGLVFSDGSLCFYRKDVGLYLYQYNGKLYWIATNDFKFDENGSTYIMYHMFTSQIDKLPESRIGEGYDIRSFIFEKFEYKDEITTPYRVAVRDIPQEYPIVYVMTGVMDLDNNIRLWSEYFHIDNDISKE